MALHMTPKCMSRLVVTQLVSLSGLRFAHSAAAGRENTHTLPRCHRPASLCRAEDPEKATSSPRTKRTRAAR